MDLMKVIYTQACIGPRRKECVSVVHICRHVHTLWKNHPSEQHTPDDRLMLKGRRTCRLNCPRGKFARMIVDAVSRGGYRKLDQTDHFEVAAALRIVGTRDSVFG